MCDIRQPIRRLTLVFGPAGTRLGRWSASRCSARPVSRTGRGGQAAADRRYGHALRGRCAPRRAGPARVDDPDLVLRQPGMPVAVSGASRTSSPWRRRRRRRCSRGRSGASSSSRSRSVPLNSCRGGGLAQTSAMSRQARPRDTDRLHPVEGLFADGQFSAAIPGPQSPGERTGPGSAGSNRPDHGPADDEHGRGRRLQLRGDPPTGQSCPAVGAERRQGAVAAVTRAMRPGLLAEARPGCVRHVVREVERPPVRDDPRDRLPHRMGHVLVRHGLRPRRKGVPSGPQDRLIREAEPCAVLSWARRLRGTPPPTAGRPTRSP